MAWHSLLTTGRTFTTTIRYDSSKSSAEWIEEAPSLGRAIAALDSFGTVKFTAGGVTVDGAKRSPRRSATTDPASACPHAATPAYTSIGSSYTWAVG